MQEILAEMEKHLKSKSPREKTQMLNQVEDQEEKLDEIETKLSEFDDNTEYDDVMSEAEQLKEKIGTLKAVIKASIGV